MTIRIKYSTNCNGQWKAEEFVADTFEEADEICEAIERVGGVLTDYDCEEDGE